MRFSLAVRTANVIFSTRLGLMGELCLRCRIDNCWRRIRISRSFSWLDNRVMLMIDIMVENEPTHLLMCSIVSDDPILPITVNRKGVPVFWSKTL
jgi:hypothetical protein